MKRNVSPGAALCCLLLLGGCSREDEPRVSTTRAAAPALEEAVINDACDLTDPRTVAEVFGGTGTEEQAGPARNCSYPLQGAAASEVVVFYFGPAHQWDIVRRGYEEHRGPVTPLPGIGDDAFYPADAGRDEIVARSGNVIFAVAVPTADSGPVAQDRLEALARRIALDVDDRM